MPTLILFFAGVLKAMLMYRLAKLFVVLPILYFVSSYILEVVVSIASDIVLPSELYGYLKYFYIDECISIWLAFLNLRGIVWITNLYIKAI